MLAAGPHSLGGTVVLAMNWEHLLSDPPLDLFHRRSELVHFGYSNLLMV